MARIRVDEIEGLISVEKDFWYGVDQVVLKFLGAPVLYGPKELTRDSDESLEVEQEFKERIARILGGLLAIEGLPDGWQLQPLGDED